MASKAQRARDHLLRLLFWGTIAIIVIFCYFCLHPFTWKNSDKLLSGATISLDAMSDFLLIVDYQQFEHKPSSFVQTNFSLAWLNTLQQEIGPVALIDASKFTGTDLARYKFVIVSQSAANHDAWVPRLKAFLERGGTLVLEMPQGELRTIASADGKGGIRATQNITYAADLPNQYLAALAQLDLSNLTQLIGSAGPLEDSTTLLTIDGVPVIYKKAFAQGEVITVDFNYGMLLTSLQQGRPLDDFSIRNRQNFSQIETADLSCISPELYPYPLADILERYFVHHVLSSAFPVVGFWSYFDAMDGAVLFLHPENSLGDSSIWLAQFEASFKASSSYFIESPTKLSMESLAQFEAANTDLALQWHFPDAQSPSAVSSGPFPFSPVKQALNLSEQWRALETFLGSSQPLLATQSADFRWTDRYTKAFQILASTNVRMDASYAPPTSKSGYAFGTGLPFMPIDIQGLVFNIFEFPLTFTQFDASQTESLTRLLDESLNSFHQTLSINFPVGQFIQSPSVEDYQALLDAYALASQKQHWITSLKSFFRFTRARQNAEIQSKFTESSQSPKKRLILSIESLAPESGMSLHIPQKIADKQFVEARRGINRVKDDSLLADLIKHKPIILNGVNKILLPLSKGFNAIDAVYE